MPLDLHEDCQSRLRASLKEQLQHATVHHGLFVSGVTSLHLFAAQEALPKNGKQAELIQRTVGEAPLVDFVSGVLSRELCEGQEYKSDKGLVPLKEISGYEDLGALADRLVAAFESLPWRYALTVQLPEPFSKLFHDAVREFELTSSMRILCGNTSMCAAFPLSSGIEKRDQAIAGGGLASLLIPEQPQWKSDRAYLQIEVDGYIGKYGSTEPLLEAISAIRSFYGLGIALRLFKPVLSYHPYPVCEKVYIHRQITGQWIVEDVHELDTRHSEVIRGLHLHDLDGVLDDDAKRVGWIRSQLSLMATVFAGGEKAKNILLGAQWLLDSYSGADELLQFVQAAVVVEILLGDKASSDQTGLGELLANRCAYLIATKHSERVEMLREFRAIYEVRSKIVHRGKSRLLLGERALFNKLRWMCRRIVQEEAELLANETAGTA